MLASAHLPPVPSPVITARRRQAESLNRTHAAEKITRIELGPYTHFGKASYFDDETRLPDGSTYREKVIATIRARLTRAGLGGRLR